MEHCLQQESYLHRLHREHKERQARLNRLPEPKPKPALVTTTENPKKVLLQPGLVLKRMKFDGHAPLVAMLGLIAEYFHTEPAILLGQERHYRIAHVRQIACAVIYHIKRPKLSTTQVGHFMGGRDHSTVINSIRRVNLMCARSEAMRLKVAEISCMCQQLKWPQWR